MHTILVSNYLSDSGCPNEHFGILNCITAVLYCETIEIKYWKNTDLHLLNLFTKQLLNNKLQDKLASRFYINLLHKNTFSLKIRLKKSQVVKNDLSSQCIFYNNSRCILIIQDEHGWYFNHLHEHNSSVEFFPCNSKDSVFEYMMSLFGDNINILAFDIKILTAAYAKKIKDVCYLQNENDNEHLVDSEIAGNGANIFSDYLSIKFNKLCAICCKMLYEDEVKYMEKEEVSNVFNGYAEADYLHDIDMQTNSIELCNICYSHLMKKKHSTLC